MKRTIMVTRYGREIAITLNTKTDTVLARMEFGELYLHQEEQERHYFLYIPDRKKLSPRSKEQAIQHLKEAEALTATGQAILGEYT